MEEVAVAQPVQKPAGKRKKKIGKPTEVEIRDRRLEIARLRRKGMTAEAIGRHLGVRKKAVLIDLEILKREWLERASAEYDEMMSEQLGELFLLRADALKAFEGTKHIRGKPEGDARFLEIARGITNDIIDLLGLKDREAFDLRRTIPQDEETVKTTELVVTNREELEQLRDENGNISLIAYLKRLKQAAESAEIVPATAATAAGG